MIRMHVYISGYVQGVCFRAATRHTAAELNLTGWVRNMEDGRVEALFEGDDADVQKAVKWCKTGPPAARVEKVAVFEEHPSGAFADFSIKRF